MTNTDKPDFREDLSKATELLRNAGFVIIHSDCGWLIACDASKPEAVQQLCSGYAEKEFDAVVLCATLPRLQQYTGEIPDIIWELCDVNDKPMIFIPDAFKNLPEPLLATKKTGFRISAWPFTNYLCERFRNPLFCLQSLRGKIDPEKLNISADKVYTVKHNRNAQSVSTLPSILKIGNGGTFTIIRK